MEQWPSVYFFVVSIAVTSLTLRRADYAVNNRTCIRMTPEGSTQLLKWKNVMVADFILLQKDEVCVGLHRLSASCARGCISCVYRVHGAASAANMLKG